MDINLQQESLSYYAPVCTLCVSQECAADSVVPDRLPDVYRLLDTNAAVYLRRRRVGAGEITLEGEIRASVLFQGEEDPAVQKLDFELPCSFTIPAEGAREEDRLRSKLSVERADARIVNPRKLGLTVEVRALAELYRYETAAVTTGVDGDELETLLREETVTYAADLGEKSFAVIEECTIPADRPAIRELLQARAEATITDQKTVGGKSILQGSARWELRYLDTEGNPAQERFSVPFSQLIDIPEDSGGGVDVILSQESAYAEIIPSPGGSDSVSLELHLLAQTLCWARKTITLLSDAYSIRGLCRTETAQLCLTAPAERQTLRGNLDTALETTEPASQVLWSYVIPGLPEAADGAVTLPLRLHALFRTESGELCALKRTAALSIPDAEHADALQYGEAVCGEPSLLPAGERLQLHISAELPALRLEETSLDYMTGAELSQEEPGEENTPSLIVLRPQGRSLWELAKRYHSTIDMIRASNPETETDLLLIPRVR